MCGCAAAVSRLRSCRSRAAPDWEAALEELAEAQAVHQQAFHAAYPASARPKHHYRRHHPEQLRNLGHYVDMCPVEACHQRYYKGSTADHYAHLVNRAGGALSTGVLWRYLQDALLAAEGPPVDPDNTSWRLEPPLLPEGSEQRTDILACCGVTRGASSLLAAGPRILQAGDHLRVGDAVYVLEGFCHDFNNAKIWAVAAQMPRVSGDWTHCRCGPPAAMRRLELRSGRSPPVCSWWRREGEHSVVLLG